MWLITALPFFTAAGLTIAISLADRMGWNLEKVAGYGFLFGTPWASILDRNLLGDVHSRWLQSVMLYAVILWVPALLYAACLSLLLHFGFRIRRTFLRIGLQK